MLSTVDEARIRLYEQIRDVPTVDGGLLSDSGELVHIQQSQVDLKDPRKKFKRTTIASFSGASGLPLGLPAEVGDAVLFSLSPCDRRRATSQPRRRRTSSNGRRVLRVSLSKLHGKVHNDGFHGHASWSSDERPLSLSSLLSLNRRAPVSFCDVTLGLHANAATLSRKTWRRRARIQALVAVDAGDLLRTDDDLR